MLDRDVAAYETETTPSAAAPASTSRASEYTPAATVDWTDEQLLATYGALGQDPAAQDQIIATLEWRDEQNQLRDREIAEHREQHEREQAAAWAAAIADPNDASPLTNPARRAELTLPGPSVPRGVRQLPVRGVPDRRNRVPRAPAHQGRRAGRYRPRDAILRAGGPGAEVRQ